MNTVKIDNVCIGTVFVYDTSTGDVLWTHEEIIESSNSPNDYPIQVSQSDCDNIRAEAQQVFPERKIDALRAPESFSLRENTHISVDVNKKIIIEREHKKQSLAERLAEFRSK